jgi:hypothetical protein
MHNYHIDAPDRIVSLDNNYFIWSHLQRFYKIAYKPLKRDVALQRGDDVELVIKHPRNLNGERSILVRKGNSNQCWIEEFKLDEKFRSINTPNYNAVRG